MRSYTLVCVVFVLLSPGHYADAREWTDSTGKFRIQAEMVAVRGDKVVLERADGQIVSLPISRLSKKDQDYLSQRRAKPSEEIHPAAEEPELGATEIVDDTTLVFAALKKACYRCHGKDGADEGGFADVLNRDKLIAAGYVVPNNAMQSPLIKRMASKDSPMPPNGESPRLTREEFQAIGRWIQEGAPQRADAEATNRFFSTRDLYERVASDLRSVDDRDREFVRYFSVAHLNNAGVSPTQLTTYRSALAKLINSLSWNRRLAELAPIGRRGLLFRVDIRDLRWTAQDWKEILSYYPHGLVVNSREAAYARSATKCEVPVVRADWFVSAASRPPLYHVLANIPSTDRRLETLLRVDVKQNIDQGRVVRVGFTRSGVSQNNRLIERHESIFGAYWKSYDFAGNTGRKNLFENPLGPGVARDAFEHDGGEIIFRLPNGMLGYMLTDANGNRIDRGPIEIVSDPRQPDRTVVNGISCMSCHYGGFIEKSDEIRRHVLANKSAYGAVSDILSLYPEKDTAKRWIDDDTRDYLQTLSDPAIGLDQPTRAGEPIVLISNRYGREVDAKMVAAELGLLPSVFERELRKLSNAELQRQIGALKTPGGVVKRETFDQLYLTLATTLKLGSASSMSAQLRSRIASARMPARRPARMVSPPKPRAVQAFESGMEAAAKRKWSLAVSELESALGLSDDDAFTARVYEALIPLYERGQSLTPLIKAHAYMLDQATNESEIHFARAALFNSMGRFSNKTRFWSMHHDRTLVVDWESLNLPSSVTNALANTFEEQLKSKPDHEPALQVMYWYYNYIRENEDRRFEILSKLEETAKKVNRKFDSAARADFAFLLNKRGKHQVAAEIYADLATQANSALTVSNRMKEAECWTAAGERGKARDALELARKKYRTSSRPSSYRLVQIGDAFNAINEPARAGETYRMALKLEQNPRSLRDIQDKIRALGSEGNVAAVASPTTKGGQPPMAKSSARDLMDPRLSFRLEAEQAEKYARDSSSSRYRYFTTAAEKWILAERTDKAKAAADNAVKALRVEGASRTYELDKLAKIYLELNENQLAVDTFVVALRSSKDERSVAMYQASIQSVLDDNSDVKISDDDKPLMAVDYKHRASAKHYESVAASQSSASSKVSSLFYAAKQWVKANDPAELKRVGALLEAAIKQATASSERNGRKYSEIAELYASIGVYEAAVRCYVNSIPYAYDDDAATKQYQLANSIAEQHSLPMPELDSESAKRLDPLNRHRVKAAEYEDKARASASASNRYWHYAMESWLDAKETDKALSALEKHAKLMSVKPSSSEYDYRRLAEDYVKCDAKDKAIEAYEKAISLTKSDYSIKKYQECIKVLQLDLN